jgi:hypothetical protein
MTRKREKGPKGQSLARRSEKYEYCRCLSRRAKLLLCLIKHNIKMYGGLLVKLHAVLTSGLDVGERRFALGRFGPGKEPPYLSYMKLSGSQSRSSCRGKENTPLPLEKIKP